MDFILVFIVCACACMYACIGKQSQAPAPTTPAIDTSAYPPVCDTLNDGTLDCPDLLPPNFFPPAQGPRDSPNETLGREALWALVGPQEDGSWSRSESTGTQILCSHYAKILISKTSLSFTPDRENEHIEKADASSSHLHHNCISSELSIRYAHRDAGHYAPVHF